MSLNLEGMKLAMIVSELEHLRDQMKALRGEVNRRRKDCIEGAAKRTKLSVQEIQKHADRKRAAFALPFTDWAAVQLRIMQEKEGGCPRRWPVVSPQFDESSTQGVEDKKVYRRLFLLKDLE